MSEWRTIETLDLSEPQFVLVAEDDAIRLLFWMPGQQAWTQPDLPFARQADVTSICANPTHWMPLPKAPK